MSHVKIPKLTILRSKPSYTLRELPSHLRRDSFAHFLVDIENEAKRRQIEKLRRPGEKWAFSIYGHGSHQVFSDIDLLAKFLGNYQSHVDWNELVKHVRFIKFGGTSSQYKRMKKELDSRAPKNPKKQPKKRVHKNPKK